MKQKRFTVDQIIPKLRSADVDLGKGLKGIFTQLASATMDSAPIQTESSKAEVCRDGTEQVPTC